MQMLYDAGPRGPILVTLAAGVLEGLAAAGVDVSCNKLDGWWEPTGTTGKTEQRAYQSGGWVNEAFSEPRSLVVGGLLRGADRPTTRAALEALLDLVPVDALVPLAVNEDGLVRHVMVRQEGKPLIDWKSDTLVSWNIQLTSPEWRRFSGTGGAGLSHSVTVGLPTARGGFVLPFSLPFTIDASVISGSVDVVNLGTAPSRVSVAISGPVSRPSIRTPDGRSMTFDLDVLAGQTLVIDFDAGTVLLNGVSRRGTLLGQWLDLTSGNTTLTFDAGSYNDAARMTVSWSDSWK